MQKREASPALPATPSGLLVLGMHRSGTSALARVLALCGADLGTRVLGESAGNEAGHWEDALAVEIHERLLAAYGTRWDEPFGLPENWSSGAPAIAAAAEVRAYVEADRAAHQSWAVKDPRLSFFAPLWIDAAAGAGQGIGAILLLRHPLEVAASLAARDGIAPGRGLLLWLEYSLAAVAAVENIPHVVLEYGQLLQDWQGCIERVRELPGAEGLRIDPARAKSVETFLDAGRRHHRHDPGARMPGPVAQAWRELSGFVQRGRIPPGTSARLAALLQPARELLQPVLDESRVIRQQLWERIGRAEARLVDATEVDHLMHANLEALREAVERQYQGLIDAFSGDVQRMQSVAADALQSASARASEARLAGQLAPRLSELEAGIRLQHGTLIDAISVELKRMQSVTADAVRQAAESEREAAIGRQVAPFMQSLEARMGQLHSITAERDRLEAELATERKRISDIEAELATEQKRTSDVEARALARTAQVESQARALTYEVARLREDAALLAQIRGSKSWRWTRPLRFVGRLLRGEAGSADAAAARERYGVRLARFPLLPRSVRKWLVGDGSRAPSGIAPAASLGSGEANLPRLEAPQPGLPDVFVWAVIDWHFRTQRPQHLARALAERGHRVFYISNNFVDSAEPGFHIDPIDASGRLFQLHLNLAGAPAIYFGLPGRRQLDALRASFGTVLRWARTEASLSLVQHPFWSDLASSAPNARVVYDCMDHHAGFENNAPEVIDAERALVADADLVILTSEWLEREVAPHARATALVRNAGDAAFFASAPKDVFRDPAGRQVIGYFGAIAGWFDLELVRKLAIANPDKLVLLIGNDTVDAAAALDGLGNVRLVGEVPYPQLPYWLHGFDVALLPFRVIELTMATNPVKVYEYLAAGKPVVAVDLPEMAQFDGLVRVGRDHESFVAEVAKALADPDSEEQKQARRQFAAAQTWAHRAQELDSAIEAIREPLVSVIVLTYNNLGFSQNCLFSIESYSDYPNLEVIVVDNASSDGSQDWLRQWASEPSPAGHARRLILNDANLGFAAGNNVGLAAAAGEYLILLNNDTYVTHGWVRTLLAHLRRDKDLGLVGPVTNNIGNEAKLEIAYGDIVDMHRLAGEHTRAHPGDSIPLRTAAFFCVAMPRTVYERVGGLDEAFGVGFFEDDDYCRRVEQAGWRIACAEDVFVHHHLSASFDQLKAEAKKQLFEANKAIYEAKWGPWRPHEYRANA